jgi:hypothetical protein
MSRFEEAKARLRGVGGGEEDSPESALDDMRDVWSTKEDGGPAAGEGETPMTQHHKDAAGCARSVGFQFSEDTDVPGEQKGASDSWSDILEREGKRGGKSLFSFDKSGKPVVNMRVEPPTGH